MIDQARMDQLRAAATQAEQAKLERATQRGTQVGAAAGNGVTGGWLVYKAFKGGIKAPVSWLGQAFSVLGVGVSSYELGKAGVALVTDLKAPQLNTCSVVQHGLKATANGLILGGTIGIASGAGAAPGTLAVAGGILLDAGSDLLSCDANP